MTLDDFLPQTWTEEERPHCYNVTRGKSTTCPNFATWRYIYGYNDGNDKKTDRVFVYYCDEHVDIWKEEFGGKDGEEWQRIG